MPRDDFEQYYSPDKLTELVACLNAFGSEYSPWQLTKARKQHIDVFGKVIGDGEYYYKCHIGVAFDDVIKLSESSMDRLCYILFRSTFTLKPIAEQILKKKRDALASSISELRIPPFDINPNP